MKVLVCGSRHAKDYEACWRKLDQFQPAPDLVISGGTEGIDTFATTWAMLRGIPCMVFPAAWIGPRRRAAGGIRNGWMLTWGNPDVVLAFPGASGTEDMVSKATEAGVEVRRITYG